MGQNYDVAHAPDRMAKLLDRIFEVVPTTTIILSTLLPNGNKATEARVLTFNHNLIDVVKDRRAKGKSIILVDMHSSCFSTADLHADGTHPTDAGYLKMASVFYEGIVTALPLIPPPRHVAGINDKSAPNDKETPPKLNKCPKAPANTTKPARTHQGSGPSSGDYVRSYYPEAFEPS